MADDLEKHFLAIIQREFPKNAELHARRESGNICIYADWKLGNDPARPKRSEKIKICIDQAALEDYTDGGDGNRKSADQRLQKLVAAQLQVLVPIMMFPPTCLFPSSNGLLRLKC